MQSKQLLSALCVEASCFHATKVDVFDLLIASAICDLFDNFDMSWF